MKKALFVFLFSIVAIQVGAETLKELIIRAIEKNHIVKASRLEVEISKQDYKASIGLLFPHIWFEEKAVRSDNPPFVWMTKMSRKDVDERMMNLKGFNDPDATTNFHSSINLRMPLFHGGEILSTIRMKQYLKEISEKYRIKTREEIALEIVKAYLEICWLKSRVKAAQMAVKTAAKHVKDAEARYRQGTTLKSDVLKAQVFLAKMKERLSTEKKLLDIAKRKLSILVGESPMIATDTDFNIVDLYELYKGYTINTKTLIDEALKRRADLLAVQKMEDVEKQNLKRAYSDYFPKLDIVSSFDWFGHNFPGDSDGASWTVGVVARINVFDGFIRERMVKKAKIKMAKVRQIALQKEKEVMLDVINANLSLNTARNKIDMTRKAVLQAEESLRIIEKRYRVGLVTMTEVTDTQSALEEAKALYLGAIHEYLYSLYQLQYAAGKLLEFIGVEGGK